MEEFPPNSRTKKNLPEAAEQEERKKDVQPVTTGEVIVRKKPLHKRFAETFLGGDGRNVGDYLVMDVLIPAIKDTIADAMTQGVEKMLWGEARSTSRRTGLKPGGGIQNYTSYNRYSTSPTQGSGVGTSRFGSGAPSRRSHDLGEIVLATRVEADEVLNRLAFMIEKYDAATVNDLYDLVNVSGNYTDDKWGWTDLSGAGVRRVHAGYLLQLPRPEPIE